MPTNSPSSTTGRWRTPWEFIKLHHVVDTVLGPAGDDRPRHQFTGALLGQCPRVLAKAVGDIPLRDDPHQRPIIGRHQHASDAFASQNSDDPGNRGLWPGRHNLVALDIQDLLNSHGGHSDGDGVFEFGQPFGDEFVSLGGGFVGFPLASLPRSPEDRLFG
jgi:hypothetical protein